jgi:hypothetical protein
MAFWSNWSDGKKWLMGILSALIIAVLIGAVKLLFAPGNSEDQGQEAESHKAEEATVDQANVSSGSNSTSPAPQTPVPSTTAEECPQGYKCVEGFEFLLEKCAPEGGDLNCWFKVTNRRQGRDLRIVANRSSLNDQTDTTHDVKRVLASNGKREMVGLTLKLPVDSSKRFGLNFEGLAGHATSITLLYVHTMDFDVDWRDVPISN